MKNFKVIPKTVHMILLTKPEANTAKTDNILRLKHQFCCPTEEIKASTWRAAQEYRLLEN